MMWNSLLSPEGTVRAEELDVGSAARACYSIKVLQNADELQAWRESWDDLARNALEPNVFYESWMFLPAIRAFGAGASLRFVLVFDNDQLCGFFPLRRRWGFKGLPVTYLSLWRHRHLYLGLPLLRASCARDCLRAFLGWLKTHERVNLLEWPLLPGEGATHDLVQEWGASVFVDEDYRRPLLRRGPDVQSFLQKAVSSSTRKDMRRKERRLNQLGRVNVRWLGLGDNLDEWIGWFLRLESSGWKGREGTALACRTEDRGFFEEVVHESHRRGQLRMLGMFLNNEPIAMKCNFVPPVADPHEDSRRGCFAFKIAFDERHAALSPGAQLELANIHDIHEHEDIAWVDSCSAAGPTMFDRLWADHRRMQTMLMSTGRPMGNWIVSLLPRLRRVKQTLARWGRKLKGNRGGTSHVEHQCCDSDV